MKGKGKEFCTKEIKLHSFDIDSWIYILTWLIQETNLVKQTLQKISQASCFSNLTSVKKEFKPISADSLADSYRAYDIYAAVASL